MAMVAADRRHDLRHVVADLVQLEHFRGDRFAQLAIAGGVGVEGVAGPHRRIGIASQMNARRRHVGLAVTQLERSGHGFQRWLRSAPSAIPRHSGFLHADSRMNSSRAGIMPDMTGAASAGRRRARLDSVDALRGGVMIVMALDHVRDFIHRGAMSQSPTDLATTTPHPVPDALDHPLLRAGVHVHGRHRRLFLPCPPNP